MPLDAITLANNAEPDQVWDMFWQFMRILNRQVVFAHGILADGSEGDVNLGDIYWEGFFSLNLLHTQVLFDNSEGHSHSAVGDGAALGFNSIRGRNFDKDSLRVLWAHYFDDKLYVEGDTARFTLCTGEKLITTDANGGIQIPPTDVAAGYAQVPGTFITAVTLDLDVFAWFDSTANRWLRWTPEVLAIFVTAVDSDRTVLDAADLVDNTRVYTSGLISRSLSIEGLQPATQYRIYYLVVLKYGGL